MLRQPSFLLQRFLCRPTTTRCLSSTITTTNADVVDTTNNNINTEFTMQDALTLHHGKRPRFRGNPKFKSPRKRASKLFAEIQQEAVEANKEKNASDRKSVV